jgi:hypothetical protein
MIVYKIVTKFPTPSTTHNCCLDKFGCLRYFPENLGHAVSYKREVRKLGKKAVKCLAYYAI